MKLRSLFKRRYPYAPIAYLGRKTVEKVFDADITKLKKVRQQMEEETTNS